MAWKKSSEGLKAIFNTALPADPRVERRQMFGYPSALVNGHLFAGLHEERMVVRLDEAGRNELLGVEGARVFEPMKGRPMREYVVVPPSILGDQRALRRWTARALSYVATLPPKGARPTRGKATRKSAAKRPRAAVASASGMTTTGRRRKG